MKSTEIFSELKNKYRTDQAINLICEHLIINFDYKLVETYEDSIRLAYIFYILDDLVSAKDILELFVSIEFSGNYRYWTWIEMAIVLNHRIEKSFGIIKDGLKDFFIKNINQGNELQREINLNNLNKLLSGKSLSTQEIETAIAEKDLISEFDFRLTYLMKLVKISELGGSIEFPVEKVEELIDSNINRMKIIMNNIELAGVLPFSNIK